MSGKINDRDIGAGEGVCEFRKRRSHLRDRLIVALSHLEAETLEHGSDCARVRDGIVELRSNLVIAVSDYQRDPFSSSGQPVRDKNGRNNRQKENEVKLSQSPVARPRGPCRELGLDADDKAR